MSSTKKLTRGDKKSRQYFMTERLVVTKGSLTTRNQCSSGMPWREPGSQQLLNRPQRTDRPRTYTVDIQGKIYQRTRERLRPRSQSEITPSAGNTSPPVGGVASVHDPTKPTTEQPDFPRWQRVDLKTVLQHLNSKLQTYLALRSKLTFNQQVGFQPVKGPASNQRARIPGQGESPWSQPGWNTE